MRAFLRCVCLLAPSILVEACGGDGTSADPPAAPSGLVATRGARSVDLRWTAPAGATSYVIEVADESGTFRQLATSTAPEKKLDADDKDFSSLAWYSLRVRARGISRKASEPSEVVSSAPCDELFCVDVRTPVESVEAVVSFGDAVLALGSDGAGMTAAKVSRDAGQTWMSTTVAPIKASVGGPWLSVFARGTLVVARGVQLLRSTDGGASLQVVDLPNAPAGSTESAWDDGTSFQLVRTAGNARTLWSSPDAITWTNQDCAQCADEIVHLAGRLIGLSYEGLSTQKYWVSAASAATPTQWERRTELATVSTPMGGTLAAGGVFLGWQLRPFRIVRSTDALAFTEPSGVPHGRVFHDGSQFCAHDALQAGSWAVSGDGAAFRPVAQHADLSSWLRVGARYVAYSGGRKTLYSATAR